MGDVHPEGNPHYYLSLEMLAKSAETMSQVLAANMSTKEKEAMKGRLAKLQSKLMAAHQKLDRLLKEALGEKKLKIMQYHGNFTYFSDSYYSLEMLGDIETTPGQPPAAGEITQRALAAKKQALSLVLATPYQPRSLVQRFAELSGAKMLIHADVSQVDEVEISNPIKLQEHLVKKILETVRL